MLRRGVIKRELFTGSDVAPCEEEHVPVQHTAEAIRIAGVIDERGRIAAAARVDAPAIIDLADADLAAFRAAPRCFTIIDSFTDQLADLSSRGKRHDREAAFAVDAGFLRDQHGLRGRFHFAAG